MSGLLPDESYCTSDVGRLLFHSKNDWPATVSLASVADETHLGSTFTAYTLDVKFISIRALIEDPRIFRVNTRYKEVNKLQQALSKLHKQLYLRGTFPSFPAPKLFGKADEATVEERKRATIEVFDFILDSEVLRKARALHEFMQKASEIVPNASAASEDAFFLNDIQNVIDMPTSSLPDTGAVLLPSPIEENGTEVIVRSPDANSDAYETPAESTSEFQFLELPLTFDPAVVRDQPPSAIRRFLNRMPLSSPFASQVSLPECASTSTYLVHAAKLVGSAQRAENEREYDLAFHCLKAAAQTLIQGVQQETDITMRNAIRRKTAKYLVRAERIYRTHLAYDGSQLNFDALYAATSQDPNIMAFQCSNSQLKNYSIVGVAPSLESESVVFIVEEAATGLRLVMKLLEKGNEREGRTFLPTSVPHMVQLHKFFQTEIFIILLLEFVETGRLWSFLVRYFDESERRWSLYERTDAKTEEANEETCGKVDSEYKGKRVKFSVGIDYERLARMSQQALDEDLNSPSTSAPELCTIGVDVAAAGERGVLAMDGVEVLVPGPASDEEQLMRVDEEAPARLCLAPCRRSQESAGDTSGPLVSLSMCLSECSSRLLPGRRRAWPTSKILPECLIAHWTAQLVSLLYVLHAHGEYLCDLLPDNLLIGADGNLLVTYYAKWNDSGMEGRRFEPGYAAPECFHFPFDVTPACDLWTLGALLYELLTGKPLRDAAPHGVGRAGAEVPFPDHCSVSLGARDLVGSLLLEDPSHRLPLDSVRAHPFYASIDWQLYDNPHTNTHQSASVRSPTEAPPTKAFSAELTAEQLTAIRSEPMPSVDDTALED